MRLEQGEAPPVGIAQPIGRDFRRILAPNPSPMTFWGTNTYLLGHRHVAVFDPGPDSDTHLAAIMDALAPGQSISHVFVTHAHLDHSPLAPRLAGLTGAPVLAFGDATTGRSPVMEQLAQTAEIGGGEGVDTGFSPDIALRDGVVIAGDGWSVKALWTPGHFGNHLCFEIGNTVLSGDLVMGWASSLVSPPDGDLTQFMASCMRLRERLPGVLLPGHGAPVTEPAARLDWLLSHRRMREAEILAALADGAQSAATLAARIYTDTPAALLPAASRNVLAHLIDLSAKSLVRPLGTLDADTAFETVATTPASP